MHQPFAAHYVNSPGPGCQLLMSPLGLFNLGISAGWDEGEPRDLSPQPHEEAHCGRARPGRPVKGRAGQARVGPLCWGVWVSAVTGCCRLSCELQHGPDEEHGFDTLVDVMRKLVMRGGILGEVRSLLDCRATPRTRDSMSVTCKHCRYPLSS